MNPRHLYLCALILALAILGHAVITIVCQPKPAKPGTWLPLTVDAGPVTSIGPADQVLRPALYFSDGKWSPSAPAPK